MSISGVILSILGCHFVHLRRVWEKYCFLGYVQEKNEKSVWSTFLLVGRFELVEETDDPQREFIAIGEIDNIYPFVYD